MRSIPTGKGGPKLTQLAPGPPPPPPPLWPIIAHGTEAWEEWSPPGAFKAEDVQALPWRQKQERVQDSPDYEAPRLYDRSQCGPYSNAFGKGKGPGKDKGKGKGKHCSKGKKGDKHGGGPEAPPPKAPPAMALAQAEVAFWMGQVPSDHPKLLQAQQALEELRQKSFLSLPVEVQAKRLKATISEDWEKVSGLKEELTHIEEDIDAKCDIYERLAKDINDMLDQLKGKIQQLKQLEASLEPAEPTPAPTPQQVIAYIKKHPEEAASLSEPDLLTKVQEANKANAQTDSAGEPSHVPGLPEAAFKGKVLAINDTGNALEQKLEGLVELDKGMAQEPAAGAAKTGEGVPPAGVEGRAESAGNKGAPAVTGPKGPALGAGHYWGDVDAQQLSGLRRGHGEEWGGTVDALLGVRPQPGDLSEAAPGDAGTPSAAGAAPGGASAPPPPGGGVQAAGKAAEASGAGTAGAGPPAGDVGPPGGTPVPGS